VELHYSSQSDKVLTLEVESQSEEEQKSLEYKLYREDNSLEASLKLMRKDSRHENSYGYEWNYKSERVEQKKGGLKIKLSHKKNGKPQKIHIAYFSNSHDIEVHANSIQAPSDVSISVSSQGKKIQEITIRTSPSCVNLEVSRSGPLFRSSVCLNKHERNSVKLVSINAHYRQHKCLDIQVNLEPESSSYIDVILRWKKEYLEKALNELTGLNALFQNRSLKEIEQEIKQQLKQYKRDVIKPALKRVQRDLQNLKEQYLRQLRQMLNIHSQKLRQHMDSMKTYKNKVISYLKDIIPWDYLQTSVMKPLRQAFLCFSDVFIQNVLKHIPQIKNIVWQMARDQMESCLKKFCVEGTFCHEMFQTYQRHGLRKAKVLLQRKISLAKQTLKQKLERVHFPDVAAYIHQTVQYVKDTLEHIFGKFLGNTILHRVANFFRDEEQKFRKQMIKYLDAFLGYINHIIGQAEKDEDFKTAKAILSDAQRKIQRSWRNKQQIAEDTWKPIQENIVQRAKQVMQSRVEVKQYDPRNGDISLKVRNPFGPAQVQILSNELEAIKRKIQDSVSL